MSHSLQVRRAVAPRGVRGIVSVDGVSGRPGRLFSAPGSVGKRRSGISLQPKPIEAPAESAQGRQSAVSSHAA
jgi:hypothetical protein